MRHFINYREKNEYNEKANEVIMRGLSKPYADRVRRCESTMKVLSRLQCLPGGDCHVGQEEVKEPYYSRNES